VDTAKLQNPLSECAVKAMLLVTSTPPLYLAVVVLSLADTAEILNPLLFSLFGIIMLWVTMTTTGAMYSYIKREWVEEDKADGTVTSLGSVVQPIDFEPDGDEFEIWGGFESLAVVRAFQLVHMIPEFVMLGLAMYQAVEIESDRSLPGWVIILEMCLLVYITIEGVAAMNFGLKVTPAYHIAVCICRTIYGPDNIPFRPFEVAVTEAQMLPFTMLVLPGNIVPILHEYAYNLDKPISGEWVCAMLGAYMPIMITMQMALVCA